MGRDPPLSDECLSAFEQNSKTKHSKACSALLHSGSSNGTDIWNIVNISLGDKIKKVIKTDKI